MKRILSVLAFAIIGINGFAQDVEGSTDHKLITRYPGSKIIEYYTSDYDEIDLAIKPGEPELPPQEWLTVGGNRTAIVYEAPEGIGTAEIMKNYRDALVSKGASILFECKSGDCDGDAAWYSAKFFHTTYFTSERTASNGTFYEYFDAYHSTQRYLVSKISTAEKNYYLELGMTPKYDGHTVKICLEIVEEDIMLEGLIEVNADVIKEKLNEDGKIILYGILFETGSAKLKQESFKEIEALADYLKANPLVNVYIVGHTDDTGDVIKNVQLSKDRASAVKNALLNNYGDFASRILTEGVGPYCPVSVNDTEEGKTLNRRVEIVKRLK